MVKTGGSTRRRPSKAPRRRRPGLWIGVLVLLVGGGLLGYIGFGALVSHTSVPPEKNEPTMGSGCGPLDSGGSGIRLKAEDRAPNFTLPMVTAEGLNGRSIGLSSFRGYLVVLEFTLSSCEVSERAATVVKLINEKYSDKGLVSLSVAGTFMGADLASTVRFIRDYRVDWTVVFDERNSAFNKYGVRIAPSYFVIGWLGKILVKLEGEVTYLGFSNVLDEILGGETSSVIEPVPSVSAALGDSVTKPSSMEAQWSPLSSTAYRARLLWSRIEQ